MGGAQHAATPPKLPGWLRQALPRSATLLQLLESGAFGDQVRNLELRHQWRASAALLAALYNCKCCTYCRNPILNLVLASCDLAQLPRAQSKILQRCNEDIVLAGVLRGTYAQRFSSQPLSIQLEGDASLTQVRCLTVLTLTRSLTRLAHDCVGAFVVSRSLEHLQLTRSAVSCDCRKSASMADITFVRRVATVQTLHLQFRKLARFCACRRLWRLLLSCRLQGPSTPMFWLLEWCRQALI